MKRRTREKMKAVFKADYISGVYWTCRSLPFNDDDTRGRIVKWFEDMKPEALIRRYCSEEFEKLTNDDFPNQRRRRATC